MKTVRKFLFETDFDDDADEVALRSSARKAKVEAAAATAVVEPPPPPPPPPAPTFSEAELAEARTTAHAKGLKEGTAKGRADAQAQIEAQIGAVLATLNAQVAAMKSDLSQDRVAILGEAASLAFAMTRKVLPEFTRRGGLAEVEAVIEQCLVDLRREPRLTARVPATLLPDLEAKIAAMAAGKHFEGRINLIGDSSLANASCSIEWADGGLERHSDTIWQQVSAALDRCLTLQDIPLAPAPSLATTAADQTTPVTDPAARAGDNNVGSDQSSRPTEE